MDPEYEMALRPLVAVDDQYIVWVTVAMQLVQYLLTVEPHQAGVPQGNDSTGVVDLWQKLRNWTLGYDDVILECIHTCMHTHIQTHMCIHTKTHYRT